jgi:hypothetical protein
VLEVFIILAYGVIEFSRLFLGPRKLCLPASSRCAGPTSVRAGSKGNKTETAPPLVIFLFLSAIIALGNVFFLRLQVYVYLCPVPPSPRPIVDGPAPLFLAAVSASDPAETTRNRQQFEATW